MRVDIQALDLRRLRAPLRMVCFVAVLLLLWLPCVALLHITLRDANRANIGSMLCLFGLFLLWVHLWGRWVYRQPQLLQFYGLVFSSENALEGLVGLGLGVSSLGLLFGIQGMLGWVQWHSLSEVSGRIVLEGAGVALAVALGEELLFRGWVLDELQRDYPRSVCLWGSSLFYAGLHFIKPWDQLWRSLPAFPGLALLGFTLVWAKWASWGLDRRSPQGRLGLSIGFHGGLVWTSYVLVVGERLTYTHRVPSWMTGLGQDPLAGVMGLVMLGAIAAWARQRATRTLAMRRWF